MLQAQKQPEKKIDFQAEGHPFMQSLHGKAKPQYLLQYLWDYYKLPLAVTAIVFYIVLYAAYNHFTHKDTALYTALVNVAAGDTLTEELSSRFLTAQNLNPAKNTFCLYSGLLMNKEAFDAFSQKGYLYNLNELLTEEAPALYRQLAPYFVTNTEILEDNSEDLLFDDSAVYYAETAEYPMGLDLSDSPFIKKSGFPETVYLGIIKNSPRMQTVFDYLEYLFCDAPAK